MAHFEGADLSNAILTGVVTELCRFSLPDGSECAELGDAVVDKEFPLPNGWVRSASTGRVSRVANGGESIDP
jgi:hypothetical protein